jgi:hypothetical protein
VAHIIIQNPNLGKWSARLRERLVGEVKKQIRLLYVAWTTDSTYSHSFDTTALEALSRHVAQDHVAFGESVTLMADPLRHVQGPNRNRSHGYNNVCVTPDVMKQH